MGWNEEWTEYTGVAREYIFPWINRPLPWLLGQNYTLPVLPALKDFVTACQSAGMIVSLFCVCGGELILEAKYEKSVNERGDMPTLPTYCKYSCPKCGSVWSKETEE